jgi:hypothetical protein
VHSRGTSEVKKLRGEIGVFTGTIRHEAVPSTIFLRMEFEDESYRGFLVVGEPMFCLQIDNLLQEHVGRTIAEIGDIDLNFTL